MAKLVIYNGPPAVLGRFGKVQKGKQLLLKETEWEHVKDDPLYKLLGAPDETEPVALKDTASFRLTSLPWGTSRAFRAVQRKGRKQLCAIARAMEELGLPCAVSSDMDRDQLADTVLSSARSAGWL
jgi:hypothetical protein